MRKKNTEDKKLIKQVNEDTNVVKKFVFILIGVIIVSILLYILTVKYLKVDNTTPESTDTTISYTSVNAGNVFNRPYDNYYVFAYDTKGDNANYYGSIFSTYQNESTNKKIYSMDLNLAVNKKYVSDKSNKAAKNTSELSIKDPTLIEIKDGKIVNYYDTEEAIMNILK